MSWIVENRKETLRICLGFFVTALCAWILYHQGKNLPLKQILHGLDARWIGVGLLFLAAAYGFRILRWQLLITEPSNKPSYGKCAVTFLASIGLNNTLPLRAGDGFRAFGVSRQLGSRQTTIIAAMLLEKIWDMLALILFLYAGTYILSVKVWDDGRLSLFLMYAVPIALGIGLSTLIFFLWAHRLGLLEQIFAKLRQRSLGRKLTDFITNFSATLSTLTNPHMLGMMTGHTILSWMFEIGVFVAVAFSIPTFQEKLSAVVIAPVATLSTLAPSSPGYFGTFHLSATKAAEILGNDAASSLLMAVMCHLMLWIPTTVIGLVCLLTWSLSSKKLGDKIQFKK